MNQQKNRLFLQLVSNYRLRRACRVFSISSRHHKVNISYQVYPEESQLQMSQHPAIFILHGMFASKGNWHSLARRISSVTHRAVVTLDARNHGESDHTPDMDYLIMRDDLLGVMDRLKVERSILLGHSMGGKTVMTCALSVPERVSRLIVVDTAPKDSPGANALKVYAQKMKEIPMPSPSVSNPEARHQVGKLLQVFVKEDGVRQFLLTNLKQSTDNSYYWRINLDAIINNFHSLHSFPEFTAPCSIPTIFIGGGNSQHIDSTMEPSIQRLFPGATIKHIPGAGHWVHSEKPTEFVDIVKQFILT